VRGIAVTGQEGDKSSLTVNLYVNFAYNSAELTPDARITLDRLGYALRDDRLSGFAFVIEGHTDARGGVDFNQALSERRAEAVRQYLTAQFGIDPGRLTARGFGKSRLLDEARPLDGVNRRVQVVNVTASSRR
jgi:outer membrane protein OmpA-like peptidoglycan-associated protein